MSKVEFKCPECQKSVLGECAEGKVLKCPECLLECELKGHPLRNKVIENIYKCVWVVVAIPLGFYIDRGSLDCGVSSWLGVVVSFLCTFMSPFIGYFIAKAILFRFLSKSKTINKNHQFIESKSWFGMGSIFVLSWISVILLMILPLGVENIKQSNFQGLLPGGFYYGDDDYLLVSILCLVCPVVALLTLFLPCQSRFLVYRWLIRRNAMAVILGVCFFWMIVNPFPLRQFSASRFGQTIQQMKEIGAYMNAYYSDGTTTKMFSYSEIVDMKRIHPHDQWPVQIQSLEDLIFLYPEGCNYAEIDSPSKPILVMRHKPFQMCTPVLYGDGHVEIFYGHFKTIDDLLRAIKDRKERGIW